MSSEVRPVALNQSEQTVLSAALTGWLDALQAEALRKSGTHPVWRSIAVGFETGLAARIREANLGQDDERLRQEVVLFASKIDVDEELARLTAHLSELRRIVNSSGAVGKRLDFLMQELNRLLLIDHAALSKVDVSPSGSPSSRAFNSLRMIFPLRVFGKPLTN